MSNRQIDNNNSSITMSSSSYSSSRAPSESLFHSSQEHHQQQMIPREDDAQTSQPHHHAVSFSIDPNSPALSHIKSQHESSSSASSLNPTEQQQQQHYYYQDTQQHRHMTLWDLISLGVGGTVGSGIFVLTGQIANQHAGPATFLSWLLAGICATTSALSLCELASRIPLQGSTYSYCRVAGLGKTCAVVAAACLTLEYVISGAAVARSWGDKVIWWCAMTSATDAAEIPTTQSTAASAMDESLQIWQAWLFPGQIVNIPALLISLACTILLLLGVHESKNVANFFTSLKMVLVAFLIAGGLALFRPSNFLVRPFCPYGAAGVMRGATSSFFGYLGYDEVCVVAGEAIKPEKTVPQAILATLAIVTVCYVLASIALVGMEYYEDISPTAGFPAAFAAANVQWAAQLAAFGEIFTLPVVVLISLLAQPRLTYSMTRDGILPPIFARTSADGNLIGGTLLWGIVMVATAAFVPFTYLDDLISCGILVAFCLANCCLILMRAKDYDEQAASEHRHHSPHGELHHKYQLLRALLAYNILCCVASLLWSHTMAETDNGSGSHTMDILASFMTMAAVACYVHIACQVSPTKLHGTMENGHNYQGRHKARPARSRDMYDVIQNQDDHDASLSDGHSQDRVSNGMFDPTALPQAQNQYFKLPCVPLVPCLGIAINWYLICQLEALGLVLLVLYLGGTVALYRTTLRS